MESARIEVIDRVYAAILAAKTPAERVAMADRSHRCARMIVQCRIQQLHPEWTAEEQQNEFLRRILGHGADRYFASCR